MNGQAIDDLVSAGELDAADRALTHALERDPANAELWLLQAQLLERQQRPAESLEAARRAIALWPDPTPLWQLQLRLAQSAGDDALAVRSLHHLLARQPDDPWLNSEMGARLSATGAFDQAVPFLRIAAPALLHENCSIWNYTTALCVSGRYGELIDTQPLLDRMASQPPSAPYPPYCHLAAAKLAQHLDTSAVLRTIDQLQSSPDWLDTDALQGRLAEAIAGRRPFSIIRLDHPLSRFVCYTSLRAHLMLRPAELSAIIDSVWPDWFNEPAENTSASRFASLARDVAASLQDADIIGLPDAEIIRNDGVNLGYLAEMQRLALDRQGAFASFQFAVALHQNMPFLRPLLQGLPFLAVVGRYPDLAHRLGRFCGIAETLTIGWDADNTPDLSMQGRTQTALDALVVPFRGAVFLVAVPGPYAILFCGRIRSLGGIAIDIGAVADGWNRR